MTLKGLTCSLALTLVLGPAVSMAEEGADKGAFSEANQLLFLEDHLTDTPYPARYVYEISKSGSAGDDAENRITMTARNTAEGDAKHVKFSTTKEALGEQVEDITNARGNPLIMVFLQSDVVDMAAETGGHWRYFQKQMKLALENTATVEPATMQFQGEPVAAKRIIVRPYVDEQAHREEIGRYIDKTYEFIVSNEVPGRVLELRSTVPDGGTGTPQVERFTLRSVEKIGPQD